MKPTSEIVQGLRQVGYSGVIGALAQRIVERAKTCPELRGLDDVWKLNDYTGLLDGLEPSLAQASGALRLAQAWLRDDSAARA